MDLQQLLAAKTLMKYSRNYPAGQFSYFLLMESRFFFFFLCARNIPNFLFCNNIILTLRWYRLSRFLNVSWLSKSSYRRRWTEQQLSDKRSHGMTLQAGIIIKGPAANLALQEVNSFTEPVSWSIYNIFICLRETITHYIWSSVKGCFYYNLFSLPQIFFTCNRFV